MTFNDDVLLLDVGGTCIKNNRGKETPVDSGGSEDVIRNALISSMGNLSGIPAVGVAISGPFDYKNGIFLMKHKFASVYGRSFRELAKIPDETNLRFIHDVNCMLLGEIHYGAAKEFENVVLVSLGTGLGVATAFGKEILHSPTGTPLFSFYNKPFNEGVLEDYVSKRGFMRIYKNLTGKGVDSVKAIADKANEEDGLAISTFEMVAHILCEAIHDFLIDKKIECLLFGGQISKSFSLMEETVNACLGDIPYLKMISPVSDISNATFNGLRWFLKND